MRTFGFISTSINADDIDEPDDLPAQHADISSHALNDDDDDELDASTTTLTTLLGAPTLGIPAAANNKYPQEVDPPQAYMKTDLPHENRLLENAEASATIDFYDENKEEQVNDSTLLAEKNELTMIAFDGQQILDSQTDDFRKFNVDIDSLDSSVDDNDDDMELY
mmetsp:Transcript_23106/g.28809  ORF Transcript_23106/g.28809 Transcript_23106/m.28809 type:complete len:165 (-) Transcript_23106:342-836(-)|eukprot:CAMPEP_0197303612 /NCGR_PEP_ID=MMETSP0890-20130614/51768_1 /TAXON_ID=44058 ORGANISM="Aureoumbra lagunensis, Strain CCMP1510" /NCGR_SAMPLE_ID=MMETSP0890 /ASSEMBLY_ACC=CAM_ASM_000533 /LENGTH=164 /DNA_ID=CAMNT_0042783475 /DNA_START=605 /DNA_END=1099 /DNA_ORIENTATION=-